MDVWIVFYFLAIYLFIYFTFGYLNNAPMNIHVCIFI